MLRYEADSATRTTVGRWCACVSGGRLESAERSGGPRLGGADGPMSKSCAPAAPARETSRGTPRYADALKGWVSRCKRRYTASSEYRKHQRARVIAGHALVAGKIVREAVCRCCGTEPATEMHHHDYDRPLYVAWLCARCHRNTDRRLRERRTLWPGTILN